MHVRQAWAKAKACGVQGEFVGPKWSWKMVAAIDDMVAHMDDMLFGLSLPCRTMFDVELFVYHGFEEILLWRKLFALFFVLPFRSTGGRLQVAVHSRSQRFSAEQHLAR